jgi:hypothetical protein
MADLGTDGADSKVLDQITSVAVVAVLVGTLILCQREGAQLSILILVGIIYHYIIHWARN